MNSSNTRFDGCSIMLKSSKYRGLLLPSDLASVGPKSRNFVGLHSEIDSITVYLRQLEGNIKQIEKRKDCALRELKLTSDQLEAESGNIQYREEILQDNHLSMLHKRASPFEVEEELHEEDEASHPKVSLTKSAHERWEQFGFVKVDSRRSKSKSENLRHYNPKIRGVIRLGQKMEKLGDIVSLILEVVSLETISSYIPSLIDLHKDKSDKIPYSECLLNNKEVFALAQQFTKTRKSHKLLIEMLENIGHKKNQDEKKVNEWVELLHRVVTEIKQEIEN